MISTMVTFCPGDGFVAQTDDPKWRGAPCALRLEYEGGLGLPPQLVQPDWVLKATQLGIAQVGEHEPFPRRQLPNDDGREYLTRLSL